MGVKMKVLESKLDELLVKKAPYQLPENFKKGLVKALPYLALIGAILMVLGAWGIYQILTWTGSWMGAAGDMGVIYGPYSTYTTSYAPMLWVSLLLIVAEAVLLFMAFSPLKTHLKRGWDLLFWVSLINAAYSIVYVIATPNLMQFVMSLLGSVVGLYLLFQIRSHYMGAHSTAK